MLSFCNLLKFLMVTEKWNPAVRARGWIQLLWLKKRKLGNIKLLSLTYYKLNPLCPPSFFFEFKYALYCLQWEIDDFLFFEFLSLFYISFCWFIVILFATIRLVNPYFLNNLNHHYLLNYVLFFMVFKNFSGHFMLFKLNYK